MTASHTNVSTSWAAAKAEATALQAEVGCGPEPASKIDALGRKVYLDPVLGDAYKACELAQIQAAEKARYDSIVSKAAGAPGGCGPEPAFIVHANGVKEYDQGSSELWAGNALGAAWAHCMGYDAAPAAPVVSPTAGPAPVLSSGGAASAPPVSTAAESAAASSPTGSAAAAAYVPAGAVVPGYVPPVDEAAAAPLQELPLVPKQLVSAPSTGVYVAVGAGALAAGVALYLALR